MAQEVHPTDIDVFEESDLFLANAIKDDKENDKLDKTRYHKPIYSYIEVNSAARYNPPDTTFQDQSLTSTGSIYTSLTILYPYNANELPTIENNRIQFKLRDDTDHLNPVQITNTIVNYESLTDLDVFNVIFPINSISTLGDLANSIEVSLNQMLYDRAASQLINSSNASHMFSVTAYIDNVLNPDKISITISCQSGYQFIMSFITISNSFATIYPNPNNYTVYLDRLYSNVKQIRIIDGNVPFSDTIINSWNMNIQFSIRDSLNNDILDSNGNIIWSYVLELGNYSNDVSVFLASFETQLNTYIFNQSGQANVFTMTYVSNTGEVSITTSTYSFEMNLISYDTNGSRNLYVMLGYKSPTTESYTNNFTNLIKVNNGYGLYYYTPYTKVNFALSKYIWISINNYETIYDTLTNQYYFNKFPINQLLPIEQTFSLSTERIINKLDIQLYDETGIPYNTNMVNHSFTLEIIWYCDRFAGMNISSTRGSNNLK